MEMHLKGKIALVTGAGSGIGRAIALGLAREGTDIVANDCDVKGAESTADEIIAVGCRSLAVQANVADLAQVRKMVDRVIAEWGGIDILVNNAGTTGYLLLEDMTEEEWNRVITINLYGAFNCCKSVIPFLKQRGEGRIINIASYTSTRMSPASGAHYVASKHGILGLTYQLSYELGPYHITVNAISPGNVLTPMLKRAFTPERLNEMKKWYPLGELQQPEDIADTVVFLASGRAKQINGTNIEVDGGVTKPIAIGLNVETFMSQQRSRRESRKTG